jgi:phage minor structural protein
VPELLYITDLAGTRRGPLHDINALHLVEELGGEEYLEFTIQVSDPKTVWLTIDAEIIYQTRRWRVTRLETLREAASIHRVRADATWTLLADDALIGTFLITAKTPDVGLDQILAGSGWTRAGNTLDSTAVSMEMQGATVLAALRQWAALAGYELLFNTVTQTVAMIPERGSDRGIGFRYGYNVPSIHRTYEPPFATKLWAFGANDLGIAGVNVTGQGFVEDFHWYTSQGIPLATARTRFTREREWRDERYLLALNLYDAAVRKLEAWSEPIISYDIAVANLDALTGAAPLLIGDTVRVRDADLGIDLRTRVLRLDKYPLDRSKDKVTLSYLQPRIDSLGGSTSGGGGDGVGDFRLAVAENSTPVTVSGSILVLTSIAMTTAGLANGVMGARAVGTASGTGTVRFRVLLDGTPIGGQPEIVFTGGQIITWDPTDWTVGLIEGSHTIAISAQVISGTGTILFAISAVHEWVLMAGAIGGAGGSPVFTVEDTLVFDESGFSDSIAPMVVTIESPVGVLRTVTETLTFTDLGITDSPPTVTLV